MLITLLLSCWTQRSAGTLSERRFPEPGQMSSVNLEHDITKVKDVDVYLNRLNKPHFLILVIGLLIILTGCINYLSPFLDIIRMFMPTISFLGQRCSWILCVRFFFKLWSELFLRQLFCYVYFIKRIGIAFFLHLYFFGFTQSFRICGHAFVYNR